MAIHFRIKFYQNPLRRTDKFLLLNMPSFQAFLCKELAKYDTIRLSCVSSVNGQLSCKRCFDLCSTAYSVCKYEIEHRELWNCLEAWKACIACGWSPLLSYFLFYFLHIVSNSLIDVLITVFTLCFIYLTACYIITNHVVISILVRQFINCLL